MNDPERAGGSLPVRGMERERFLLHLLGDLAETLENVVGVDHASAFVSAVGRRMGRRLHHLYQRELESDDAALEEILVDLKRRIGASFEVEQRDEREILMRNGRCPLAEAVQGHESLCMMTSNVFGSIAAERLGYARVELLRTIARGDGHCHVRIALDPATGHSEQDAGREYFRLDAASSGSDAGGPDPEGPDPGAGPRP